MRISGSERTASVPVAGNGGRPSPPRGAVPALLLFVLSPVVAELLLGNISLIAAANLLVLAPLYGGGAVLIREVTRRTGRGWPTILLLGLAFGLVEEGLVTQSLFNPSYFGHDLRGGTELAGTGLGAWWTLFVLTLHAVWSIGVSIALAEALVPGRASTPWLRGPGLGITAALSIVGAALTWYGTYQQERFVASPAQHSGTAIAVIAGVALAFAVRPGTIRGDRATVTRAGRLGPAGAAPAPAPVPAPAPAPWLVGLAAFAAASAFMAGRDLNGWPTVVAWLILYGAAGALSVRWARRAGWGPRHRVAMAGGALLTYAWVGFPMAPVLGPGGATDLVGNAVLAAAAVALLAWCWRAGRAPADTGAGRPRGRGPAR